MNTILSFDFTSTLSFLRSLSDLINPISVITTAIAYGILALLITALLMILFRKTIFIERKHTILKALPYIYLFFIPILAGFTVFQWFAIHKTEKQVIKNAPTVLQDKHAEIGTMMQELAIKTFSEAELNQSLGEVLDHYEKEIKREITEQKEKHAWAESKGIDKLLDNHLLNRPEQLRSYVIQVIKSRLRQKTMTTEMSNKLLEERFVDLLDTTFITQLVEVQFVETMRGIKKKALITFFLIILIPVAEIIWANQRFKKENQSISH